MGSRKEFNSTKLRKSVLQQKKFKPKFWTIIVYIITTTIGLPEMVHKAQIVSLQVKNGSNRSKTPIFFLKLTLHHVLQTTDKGLTTYNQE